MPRANTDSSEDYTDVFISHARLYKFAEKYDIQSLKRLCLRNLHQTLTQFTLWPESVNDVVSLLRFSYENTVSSEHGLEPLRYMLRQYVAWEMNTLVDHIPFRDLLEQNRDILDDFCSEIRQRA